MTDRVTPQHLYELVVGRFAARIQFSYQDDDELTVGGILYETYELECRLDEQYGSFGAAIKVGPTLATTRFFGERVSRETDDESILESLGLIDRWCRAHLPEAFLSEYERNA